MPDFIRSFLSWIWQGILEFYFPKPRPDSLGDALTQQNTIFEIFGVEFSYVPAATIKLGLTAAVLIGLFWFMVFLVKIWWKRRNEAGGMPRQSQSPIRRRTDR